MLYCTKYIPGTYFCVQSAVLLLLLLLLLWMLQYCCCRCSYCYLLLLLVIVCRLTKFVAGSLNLIPVFYFSSFKHGLFFMHPLALLSHFRPRFAYNTSSVLSGMRGAKAGVSPRRRSSPCYAIRFPPSEVFDFYLIPGMIPGMIQE